MGCVHTKTASPYPKAKTTLQVTSMSPLRPCSNMSACTSADVSASPLLLSMSAAPFSTSPSRSDGFREIPFCHPSLDDEFTKTYALEEIPKAHIESAAILGARCRLRSDSRATYFVTFEDRSDTPTTIHMFTKANIYLDLRKRRALPSAVAGLPPIGMPWTSWENWEHKKHPFRIWIVTEFLPQILSDIEWEGCSLRLLADLVRAARSLHESGYVHGDIAPPNIGFRADGRLALIDLGAATKVEFFPPGEGIETTAGHLEFMSVAQHDASVPHPADDVESCAYVALWAHTGRKMESADQKNMWLEDSGGDAAEHEIRRVARRARGTSRHEPPPDDMYAVNVREIDGCLPLSMSARPFSTSPARSEKSPSRSETAAAARSEKSPLRSEQSPLRSEQSSSMLVGEDGVREIPFCHPSLDDQFTKTYALEELPKAHIDSAAILGARCRLRSDSRATYFVTFEDRSDADTFCHMYTKVDIYLDLRKRCALPSAVAGLPPVGTSWTSWENWEHKKHPFRIWIVTEFLPQILSDIEWEGCSLRLLADLVRAVRSLHESGYVHGDIAPPNIGFRADGRLALIDLGAATKVEFFPPGEGIETTAGHLEFMSVAQHDASVPHPADDVESCAYVALWVHTGRKMESADQKTMWLEDSVDGDAAEHEIRRVARRARGASRHEPPPDDMYAVSCIPSA